MDGIDEKLAAILFAYSNADAEKGEKVVAIKCAPEPVLRKDDDDYTGNDCIGNEKNQGTSNVIVVSSNRRTQSQTNQSTH